MATATQTFGVLLPITHGPQGFFNQSYNVLDQIKTNIKMLLLTRKGERRMNPEFGSSLWSLLFENFSGDITPIINNTIKNDISRWMSYVNISDIEVITDTSENSSRYTIFVKISFTVPSIGINRLQTVETSIITSNI